MPPTLPSSHLPPRAGALPPGTVVGKWRVVESAGRGAHGAVYRAVPVEEEDTQARSVALKVALVPWDARFEREAELLSRVCHPSIPRLLAQGQWQPERGPPYPFLVMDWVEGAPLYEWAQEQGATSQQVFAALAQVAGALAAVHALKGVHRDVKGCNVRVRRSDGRAMLLDWGTGVYEGATTLTPPGTYPGTPVARPVAEPKRRRRQRWWAMAAAAGLALAVWAIISNGLQSPWAARRHTRQEADTAGLAEKVSAASMQQAPEVVDSKGMAEEPLPEPVPGQTQPNAKGQCPFSGQVVLNGVCWEKFEAEQPRCESVGGSFFKKVCYLPIASRQRPPTSSPAHEP